MLTVLPCLAFILLWLLFAGGETPVPEMATRWRRAFLLALVTWATNLILVLEGLSLVDGIRQAPLAAAWVVIVACLAAWCQRRGLFRIAVARVRACRLDLTPVEGVLAAGIAAVCATLFVVAVVSPPNNVDSLLYHMARVAHWAQNGSLNHYAAVYQHQLSMPPWAELAALNLYVLWGGDRLVNLVQWFALAASLILASGVAALLGASRPFQFLAAALVLSLPMALLQSTSTQNDLVAALWLLGLGYAVLSSLRQASGHWMPIAVGLGLGLALLTKATTLLFTPLFLVWYLVGRWRSSGGRQAMLAVLVSMLLALAVNLPYLTRNAVTYGTPVGDVKFILTAVTLESLPSATEGASTEGTSALRSIRAGMTWGVARVARAAALNLITPSFAVNQLLQRLLESFPAIFGESTIASLQGAAWNHEDTAGNPFHLLLYLLIALAVILFRKRLAGGPLAIYLACSFFGFLVLPLVLKRGSVYFGIRYQLPFFLLSAPGAAAVLARLLRPRMANLLTVGCLLLCLPWVLLNNTRPLIGMTPWPTRVGSVLTAEASDLLFASAPALADRYAALAQAIDNAGCRQVGLKIDSGDLEYLFWWTLQRRIEGVEIQIVDPLPSLTRYVDREFAPCAILCTVCGDLEQVHGLPLIQQSGRARLFAGEGYRPEADE